jgi:hypothetical protein
MTLTQKIFSNWNDPDPNPAAADSVLQGRLDAFLRQILGRHGPDRFVTSSLAGVIQLLSVGHRKLTSFVGSFPSFVF